ncbi:MAG: hypothetical protein E6Q68_06230 [Polynucleobacter sp.]|nr:MAG: hypothetical protein E6Q68_06230 [Polynucleobacter sp.]
MELLDPRVVVITNNMLSRTILALNQNSRPEVDGRRGTRGVADAAIYIPATSDIRFPLVWKDITYMVTVARGGAGWYIVSSVPVADERKGKKKKRGLVNTASPTTSQ